MNSKPVVLVTGSTKRSGLALASEFARAGYDVALHYRSSPDEAKEALAGVQAIGAKVHAYRADLKNEDEIANLVNSVFDDFGRMDVLVNNASVFRQDRLKDFTVTDLDDAWRINCRAPLLLTKTFYDIAKKLERKGAVINIVDQKIKDNFHADHFSYTVGKTAIGNLTKMLAVSCLPILTVNAIFPGLMLPSDDQTTADFEHAARISSPLGYSATPLDLARAAIELAQPRYNGADLLLDAGQNMIPVDQDVIYKYRAPK
jgi:pteridine reductase